MSGHICDRGWGFLEAIFFLSKKTASLFHPSALHVFVFVERQTIRFLIKLILFGYLLVSENAVKRN